MAINRISGFVPNLQGKVQKQSNGNFDDVVKGLIDNTIQNDKEATKMTEDFIKGEDIDLHEVMIAGEKAKTSLELLVQIRNRAIDMYKELTRMS